MSKRCMGCMETFGDEFQICPHCGHIEGTGAEEAIHIQPGTLLHDRYIVGKVLGFGGFGVTYIAWDGKLEQKVAIKEYLPGEFSTRMPGQTLVTVFNGDKSEQFRDGLKKFVDEAKRLAKFQNEAEIVKIFDSFEENSTAYIIMEYLDGETLTDYLKRVETIPADQAVEMLMPIMESLQSVHESGLLHRDIAPDNIFITKTGEIKLIDFGASRYATTSHSRSLTVIIKPGFSPEEQYRSRGDQGPYTDVYAIAATLYKMITGKTPPDAMERRAKYENDNKDILVEPHKLAKKIPAGKEIAILNAMNVRIEDRTQNIAEFIKELNADPPVKRRYGKIKKIDLYHWPLWLKIFIPTVLAVVLVFTGLLVTGVISFSHYSDKIVIPDNIVVVPDVEGENRIEALKLIEDGKLLAKTAGTVESEYISAGKIVLQTPVGGSYMEENSSILLTVSSGKGVIAPVDGKAVVPFVIWDTKEDALSKLDQAGLAEPKIEEVYDNNVEVGHVISQSIEPDTVVNVGVKLTLEISLGPPPFEIPDVEGKKLEDARNELTDLGLAVRLEFAKDDSVPAGCIISQSLKGGTLVTRGETVVLTVSSKEENISVENVVGMDKDEAVSTLEDQGFKVKVLENYDDTVPAGKVVSQTPKAGSSQIKGTEISIIVSKGAQPQTTTVTTTKPPATTRPVVTTTKPPVKMVTVNLNANGGSVSPASVQAAQNGSYGVLPTPTMSGYNFTGWYTAASGGNLVNSGDKLISQSTHTLYAHWSKSGYTLTLNYGYSDLVEQKNIETGSKYQLPSPSRAYYTFTGWFTATNNQVKTGDVFNLKGNQTLYAHWTQNPVSDWVDVSAVPAGMDIIENKYVYTETTWVSEGTKTHYYASFPGGFDTGNTYYQNIAKTPITASDTVRNVSSASTDSYIYWHWQYRLAQESTLNNRIVSDVKGYDPASRYTFNDFSAFQSKENYGHKDKNGNVDNNVYYCDTGNKSHVSWWWFRFEVKKQTYDSYKKSTATKEYSTAQTESTDRVFKQHLVRYQEK